MSTTTRKLFPGNVGGSYAPGNDTAETALRLSRRSDLRACRILVCRFTVAIQWSHPARCPVTCSRNANLFTLAMPPDSGRASARQVGSAPRQGCFDARLRPKRSRGLRGNRCETGRLGGIIMRGIITKVLDQQVDKAAHFGRQVLAARVEDIDSLFGAEELVQHRNKLAGPEIVLDQKARGPMKTLAVQRRQARDWNSLTTSPEVGASPAAETLRVRAASYGFAGIPTDEGQLFENAPRPGKKMRLATGGVYRC
jgi:hypothetical protein